MPKVLEISMQYLCYMSRKKWVMNLIFCMLIYIKVFWKLMLSLDGFGQTCIKYPDKSAIWLWYPNKEVWNEINFWRAVRRQSFPLVDTIIFACCGQACPRKSKNQVCNLCLDLLVMGIISFLCASKTYDFLYLKNEGQARGFSNNVLLFSNKKYNTSFLVIVVKMSFFGAWFSDR